MKTLKLNYFTSKNDLRPSLQHIQFNENGYIYASDAYKLIKSTIDDVFGNSFNSEEFKQLWDKHNELHIHSDEWKKIAGKQLMYCDVLMDSDNKAIVQFYDKKTQYTVTVLTGDLESFPVCDNVIPKGDLIPIEYIGIDGNVLSDVTMAIKSSYPPRFKYEFRGSMKGITLKHNELTDTTILVMPYKTHEE